MEEIFVDLEYKVSWLNAKMMAATGAWQRGLLLLIYDGTESLLRQHHHVDLKQGAQIEHERS